LSLHLWKLWYCSIFPTKKSSLPKFTVLSVLVLVIQNSSSYRAWEVVFALIWFLNSIHLVRLLHHYLLAVFFFLILWLVVWLLSVHPKFLVAQINLLESHFRSIARGLVHSLLLRQYIWEFSGLRIAHCRNMRGLRRVFLLIRLKILTFQLKCCWMKSYSVKFESLQWKFVQMGALQKLEIPYKSFKICGLSTQSMQTLYFRWYLKSYHFAIFLLKTLLFLLKTLKFSPSFIWMSWFFKQTENNHTLSQSSHVSAVCVPSYQGFSHPLKSCFWLSLKLMFKLATETTKWLF